MIVKTEAIVLKRMDYRDTSRIVTLLTRDYGRISVIAKGARDSRNRLGPLLDSLNHVQIVFYRNEGRDLHLITQCDLLQHFPLLTTDLERLGRSLAILELASTASRAEEEGQPLFTMVLRSLQDINEGKNPFEVLLRFEITLLGLLGFRPDLHRCSRCEKEVPWPDGTKNEKFRLTSGGILCRPCFRSESVWQEISRRSLTVLRGLQRTSSDAGGISESHPVEVYHEIRDVLRFFLRTHVEGIRSLKSETVFSALD